MFFIQISIFIVSCVVLISPFPVNGKECLKYIQTPPRLLVLGWPALRMEKPLMFIFPSVKSIVESKRISRKHRIIMIILSKVP